MTNVKILTSLLIVAAIITISASPVFAPAQQVATPTFSPLPGTYSTAQSVRISCSTNGAKIYYTIDGSEPTTSSTAYSNPISVNASMTINAKAFKAGTTVSNTASATYTISLSKVASPTFNPSGGSYSSPQNVTLSCATSDATICYTIDGSEPTSKSASYSEPISVNTNTAIKAKAFKTGMTDSDTASATYVIKPKISAPTLNPAGGVFTSNQSSSIIVTINCATVGATIRYTLDGSEPTAKSTLYNGFVSISSNVTIKAKAFMNGMTDSDTASATFTLYIIQVTQVSTPNFSPDEGSYMTSQNVIIQSSTVGATIRYTVDGSEPSITSTIYSGPIIVNSTTTIKAKAFNTGMADSYTALATYTIESSSDASNSVYESRSLVLVLFVVFILILIGLMTYFYKR